MSGDYVTAAGKELEQLKRDCADALEVLTRDQRVDRIAELADSLRALGPPYRFHWELMHGALQDGQENVITWHLIQRAREAREGRGVAMDADNLETLLVERH